MNNETGVKKGLTTQKYSKTKMVTHTTGTFGWSVPFLRHFRRYFTCPAKQLRLVDVSASPYAATPTKHYRNRICTASFISVFGHYASHI